MSEREGGDTGAAGNETPSPSLLPNETIPADGEAPVVGPTGAAVRTPEQIARAEAKRKFGKTSIGIAPPALGSMAPPEPRLEPRPEPTPGVVVPPAPAVPTLVAPPVTHPFPAPPPTTPSLSPAKATMPSTPPPPVGPSPAKATMPSSPPPPVPAATVTMPRASAPPSPFTATLVAAAPVRMPPAGASINHPLAATARSRRVVIEDGASGSPVALDVTIAETQSSPVAEAKIGMKTLAGNAPAGPGGFTTSPIVPRRRTPSAGMPAAGGTPKLTPLAGGPLPRVTPAAGMPATIVAPVVTEKDPYRPPIIRIPQGGMLGGSGGMAPQHTGTLICEILVKSGAVTDELVDKAIALQEERGGQIGRILVQMGACTEEAIARALIEQLRLRKDEGGMSDISAAARERKDVVGLKVLTRPGRTIAVLFATDLFSLTLAALLATAVHWARTYSELQTIDWTTWLVVGPAIALCMLTFFGLELYSPMAKSTPDEIRDITFAASLVHLGASVLSTLGDLPIVRWGVFVRGVWWLATLFFVPVVRSLVRNYFSVKPWWGIPVCVLGAAKTGRLIVRTLRAQPRSGLKPVMMLDDDIAKHGTLRATFTNEVMDVYSVNVSAAHFLTEAQRAEFASDIFGDAEVERASQQPISSDHIPISAIAAGAPSSKRGDLSDSKKDSNGQFFTADSQPISRAPITQDASQFPRGKFAEVDGVPLVGDLSLAPILAGRLKIPYAVLAMPGVDSHKLLQIVERIGGKFTHLLIIPDLFGFATMSVPAKSLGGILGVEVRQQLLLPGPRLAKRIIDLALTGIGALFVMPFLLLIAAIIKVDSKGPVFYTQKRLGRDGSYFEAYKFRTMHGDGEERLKAILDAEPALRAEYEVFHKLRKDPRVTRIGRILRKFSLDEFPQLLNVVKGDMSLVGPRPYIERELTAMGGQEKIILRAPPGMTGMWQVSDRNATSFAQRVQIDVYYVRNWSPWLDIHILAKTFGVVIKGSGV